ncbi:hypothetical protein Bca101_021348 [Brassica carinata]
MEGSRERRERGDAAREAAYQPAIDDRRSHRLSNHTSLNMNPRTISSYEPGLQTRLRFGSTTHEAHLTKEREELDPFDTEENQEPTTVEEYFLHQNRHRHTQLQ